MNYACGKCGAGKTDSCKECFGSSETACNRRSEELGENFMCYSYEFDETEFVEKAEKKTCIRLKGNPIICNRPSSAATKTSAYTNKNGCGPCEGETKGSGCEECNQDSCNKIPIKCVQGTDGTVEATDCTDVTLTKCSKPKFIDYSGFSDVRYGCGACAGETKDSTCEECNGLTTGQGCNKPITTVEFHCFSYEFSDDKNKFAQKGDADEKTTCKIKSGSPIICNRPSSTATTKTAYTNKNGCGPCEGATKGSGCEECDKDSCNKLPIKCIQGTDGTVEATDCTDVTLTKCSKPKFIDYSGFSDVRYGCGKCAGETKDSICEECDGNTDDGCNKPIKTGDDFKCYTYELDKDSKSYNQRDTTCKRLPTTDLICNMPADKDTGTDKYTNTNGCGACVGDSKKEGTCKECTAALCNKLDILGSDFTPLHMSHLIRYLLALIYLL